MHMICKLVCVISTCLRGVWSCVWICDLATHASTHTDARTGVSGVKGARRSGTVGGI